MNCQTAFHLFTLHLQKRVWEHDSQWKYQKEAEGGVDEHNIEWPSPKLRWMCDEDRHVRVDKQDDENTEKDGRCKEPFENLTER